MAANQQPRPLFTDAEHQTFLDSAPGLAGTAFPTADGLYWTGSKYLGHGGFGQVGLWLCQDVHGAIVDRMVVKENALSANRPQPGFADPRNWVNRLPREGFIQKLLTERNRNGHHVGFRGARYWRAGRREDQPEKYRLYMEFSPFGSLIELFNSNIGGGQYTYVEHDLDIRYMTDVGTSGFVPEQALWYILLCLAEACVEMETVGPVPAGFMYGVPAAAVPATGATEIVHQ